VPLIVRCPGCSSEAQVPDNLKGAAVLCPWCQRRFTAPQDAASTVHAGPSRPSPPPEDRKFCVECGSAVRRAAVICPLCGVPQPSLNGPPAPPPAPTAGTPPANTPISTDRMTAGIFALVLGWLGVHKFILGYTKQGVITLLVSACTFWIGFLPMLVVGIIEGVIYLTRTDEEFHATYVVGRKPWF
jgi:TM2 domain-containing membrane protein YozV